MSSAARAAATLLPCCPGVYRFRDGAGTVLYIGRAASLRRRVTSYWGDLGDRPHLAQMVARIARVEAVGCASEHEAAWLERTLLQDSTPRWNRTAGGQEVEVCLRLDTSPRSPGLSVVHADAVPAAVAPELVSGATAAAGNGHGQAEYFGPYLGGGRVRLAAAGLTRIFPLGYAADLAAGTAGDLARHRGVDGSDRALLACSLAAVLHRDRAAVQDAAARLTDRRDAAARSEAYELAGRIQAELRALDWVTCPQRAATLGEQEADVAGWADGMLVVFGIRAGRVRSWRQHPAALADAEPLLAGTPARWRDFARDNATLAARLALAA